MWSCSISPLPRPRAAPHTSVQEGQRQTPSTGHCGSGGAADPVPRSAALLLEAAPCALRRPPTVRQVLDGEPPVLGVRPAQLVFPTVRHLARRRRDVRVKNVEHARPLVGSPNGHAAAARMAGRTRKPGSWRKPARRGVQMSSVGPAAAGSALRYSCSIAELAAPCSTCEHGR